MPIEGIDRFVGMTLNWIVERDLAAPVFRPRDRRAARPRMATDGGEPRWRSR